MRIDAPAARDRFARARVARLATADADATPHLVPVTFAVLGDTIAFAVDHKPKRGTDLRRLRNIAANPAVTWLVDHYAEDWSALWWVRADGTARIATGPAERADPIAALRAKYPQYAERPPEGPLVLTAVTRWTGWAAKPMDRSPDGR